MKPSERTISGGRQGCAQFLKICGPVILRESSLGLLNAIVQELLNEEEILQDKTQIVSRQNAKQDLVKENTVSDEDMQVQRMRVQNALETVLKRGPITLAQIPDAIKKYCDIDVDLKRLGHNKLKDYVMADNRFYVYSKGANFPAVDLKSRESNQLGLSSPDGSAKKKSVYSGKKEFSSPQNFTKVGSELDSPSEMSTTLSSFWSYVSEDQQLGLQQKIWEILNASKERSPLLGGIAFDELLLSLYNSGYE